MKNSVNFQIALAHLQSRVKQTLVAMLSVTFGISMYVFMNSFMAGVNEIQDDLAFSTLAHIRVFHDLPKDRTNLLQDKVADQSLVHLRHPKIIRYTEGIRNAQKTMEFLEQQDEVAAITPQVNLNVFFRNGATKVNGLLSGIDTEKEDALFKTSSYMVEGNWQELKYRNDGIVLGIGLARNLGLNLRDKVVVTTADGLTKTYEIIGMLETTIKTVDNGKAYVRISSARQLVSKNQGYVTDIQVNVANFHEAREIANRIQPHIPYEVEAWQVANGQLEVGSTLRNYMALATSLTILIVAGFGIYNIMNMTVNEKIREIAILKAMGFDGRDIVTIFLTQSIIIGIMGGLAGLTFGYLISMGIEKIPFNLATLNHLPIAYRPKDYFLGFGFGILTTFLAGYLPAQNASQIDPVEIIRG